MAETGLGFDYSLDSCVTMQSSMGCLIFQWWSVGLDSQAPHCLWLLETHIQEKGLLAMGQ